jgi:hypothetical protein
MLVRVKNKRTKQESGYESVNLIVASILDNTQEMQRERSLDFASGIQRILGSSLRAVPEMGTYSGIEFHSGIRR